MVFSQYITLGYMIESNLLFVTNVILYIFVECYNASLMFQKLHVDATVLGYSVHFTTSLIVTSMYTSWDE